MNGPSHAAVAAEQEVRDWLHAATAGEQWSGHWSGEGPGPWGGPAGSRRDPGLADAAGLATIAARVRRHRQRRRRAAGLAVGGAATVLVGLTLFPGGGTGAGVVPDAGLTPAAPGAVGSGAPSAGEVLAVVLGAVLVGLPWLATRSRRPTVRLTGFALAHGVLTLLTGTLVVMVLTALSGDVPPVAPLVAGSLWLLAAGARLRLGTGSGRWRRYWGAGPTLLALPLGSASLVGLQWLALGRPATGMDVMADGRAPVVALTLTAAVLVAGLWARTAPALRATGTGDAVRRVAATMALVAAGQGLVLLTVPPEFDLVRTGTGDLLPRGAALALVGVVLAGLGGLGLWLRPGARVALVDVMPGLTGSLATFLAVRAFGAGGADASGAGAEVVFLLVHLVMAVLVPAVVVVLVLRARHRDVLGAATAPAPVEHVAT